MRTSARLRGLTFLFAALVMVTGSFAQAAFEVPEFTGNVVDRANMLDGNTAASLENALRSLREKGGPQIAVLTIKSLEGMPIEVASIQVTDKWKIGAGKEDDGVLLMVALEDRKIRIESGQGLEGSLTDLYAKRIIDDTMTPYFRAGRPSDGIVAGVRGIVEKTAPDKLGVFGEAPEQVRPRKDRGGRSIPFPIIILLLIVFSFLGRRGRRGGAGGFVTGLALGALSGRGGGGSSWGGGGGGFSGGGGGGFSGGGASGGW